MDMYDILFASLISIALLFVFTKRYGLLGRFIAGAAFIISIVVGLIHPVDTFKLVLDIIAAGLIFIEIIRKEYKIRTNVQLGIGAVVTGILVLVLGGIRLDALAGLVYISAGCFLIVQGVYCFLRCRKKAHNLSGVL